MWFKAKPFVRRIGIVHSEITGWTGGLRHIKTLTYSLFNVCQSPSTELCILREPTGIAAETAHFPAKVVPIARCTYFPGEGRVRQLLALSERSGLVRSAREHGISVLLPFLAVPFRAPDIKTICWIPDFQHVHHPEFFTKDQLRSRDVTYQHMAERCTLLLLSSRNAVEHFANVFPQHVGKVRLASFPSLFAFEPPSGDTRVTIQKFNLPEKFALVANQFWRHKN